MRRCSVRRLIRSVMSATCTSVRPVSASLPPNCWTSSCFLSLVSVMRTMRLATAYLPGLRDVALHLLDQGLDALEPALPAQPLEELHPENLPVQVHLPIQDIGLDEHGPARAEGGTNAYVHRRAGVIGTGHVDAVAR